MQLDLEIQRGRDKPAPLYQQIADGILALIEVGRLAGGTRLPTVRSLAEQLDVTPMTVQSAYSELQERSLVEAVVGRGTFVRHQPPPDPVALAGEERALPQVLRDMARFERVPGVFPMAQGNGAAELRPAAAFMRCFKSLEPEAEELLGYWAPQGCASLRAEVAERLACRGIDALPDDLILTQGVTQALDLLVQVLCRPGDSVIVESPTYLGFLGILRFHDIEPLGVPLDEEGFDLGALERALRRERPRFLYTVSTHQNPTGRSMTVERRTALLNLAEQYDLLIVEDDIYRDIALVGEPPPALAAMAPPGRVVYVDGFSKSLMPGLRVGYLVPTRSMRRRLVDAHRIRTLCGPTLMQGALAEFLRRGELELHLRSVLPIYRRRLEVLLESLERSMPEGVRWTTPEGGYCVWLTLPETTPSVDAYPAALAAGVAVAPGDRFLARPDGRQYLRLSIGGIDQRRVPAAIERLAGAIEASVSSVADQTATQLMPLV